MSGLPIRARFKLLLIQAKSGDFVQLLCRDVRQFTISFNAFSEHVLPRGTTPLYAREGFPHSGNFSVAPAQIRDSNNSLYSSIIISFGLHSS